MRARKVAFELHEAVESDIAEACNATVGLSSLTIAAPRCCCARWDSGVPALMFRLHYLAPERLPGGFAPQHDGVAGFQQRSAGTFHMLQSQEPCSVTS